MILPVFQIFVLLSYPPPLFAYYLFQSKYPVVAPVIEQCRAIWLSEAHNCSEMLQCTLDNVPGDYSARYSAGASILSLIPTIVGLMSNSVDEITAIAEESIFLAIAISLSSVTVFSSRLGDKITSAKLGDRGTGPEYWQAMRDNIRELVKENRQTHSRHWRNTRTQDLVIGIIMIGSSTMIWYQLFQITRYGIITFACPVKVNIMIWAVLGQSLTLLNVFWRKNLFDYRRIHIRRLGGRARTTLTERMIEPADHNEDQVEDVVLIFRCPRATWGRRVLQFCTAVLSYSIYTYGTVVLASTTMFEAADALRVVVVVCVTAGFGRMIGYWVLATSFRSGKKALLFDVPAPHMDKLAELIHDEF